MVTWRSTRISLLAGNAPCSFAVQKHREIKLLSTTVSAWIRWTNINAESLGWDYLACREQLVLCVANPNSAPPPRNFGASTTALKEREKAILKAKEYHMRPVDGKYPYIALDFRIYFFGLSTSRSGEKVYVVNGRLLHPCRGKRPLCYLQGRWHLRPSWCFRYARTWSLRLWGSTKSPMAR